MPPVDDIHDPPNLVPNYGSFRLGQSPIDRARMQTYHYNRDDPEDLTISFAVDPAYGTTRWTVHLPRCTMQGHLGMVQRLQESNEAIAHRIAATVAADVHGRVLAALERVNAEQPPQGWNDYTPRPNFNIFPGGVNFVRHAADLARGVIAGGDRPQPETPTAFDWIATEKIPPVIQHGAFIARLLAADLDIYREGKKMGHCLWGSYIDRIEAGNYLVYHVTAKTISKSGFTLGFKRAPPGWKFDQNKGKANKTSNDSALGYFCHHVGNVLNDGPLLAPDKAKALEAAT